MIHKYKFVLDEIDVWNSKNFISRENINILSMSSLSPCEDAIMKKEQQQVESSKCSIAITVLAAAVPADWKSNYC